MFNYIKSEIYRNLCKKNTYIFVGVLTILAIAVNVCLTVLKNTDLVNPTTIVTARNSFIIATSSMDIPFVLTIFIANMFFSEGHNNMPMKNSLGFGITRMQIFFGKFIAELIYCLAICLIVFGVYIGSAYLLVGSGNVLNSPYITSNYPIVDSSVFLNQMLQCIIYSLPLWIAGLAASNTLCFVFKHTRTQMGIFFGIFFVLPFALNSMGYSFSPELLKALSYMPSFQLSRVPITDSFGPYLVSGIFYTLIAFVVGVLLFRKAEVK